MAVFIPGPWCNPKKFFFIFLQLCDNFTKFSTASFALCYRKKCSAAQSESDTTNKSEKGNHITALKNRCCLALILALSASVTLSSRKAL